MSNEGADNLLEGITEIISVLTAADTFSKEEFNDFLYDLIDDDTDKAVDLINGVIGFFFGMADNFGVDMQSSLRSFGIAAAEQRLKHQEDV